MTTEQACALQGDITVRLAAPRDLEVCIAFDCTDPTDSRGDEEKAALTKARIETGEIFLATTPAGHPVGYLAIDRLWPMMMPLMSWVYVAPAWRGHGVARELVAFCFKNLKERGYGRVMVSTQTDRDKMLETIHKMGLREIGTLQANPDDSIGEVFFLKDL